MELQTTWRPTHCKLEGVQTVSRLVSQLAGLISCTGIVWSTNMTGWFINRSNSLPEEQL